MVANNTGKENAACVMLVGRSSAASSSTTTTNTLSNASVVRLADPSTGEDRHYILAKHPHGGCDLYETQSVKGLSSSYGSFFVGSRVISNPHLHVSTRVDPLFLALEALLRSHNKTTSSKWQPLDQLLADIPQVVQEALRISSASDNDNNMSQLKHLCDTTDKFGDDLLLYKFSPDRTLKWLEKKQKLVLSIIQQQMQSAKRVRMEQERLKKQQSGGKGAYNAGFNLPQEEKENHKVKDNTDSVSDKMDIATTITLNDAEKKQALVASLQVVCEYLSAEWQTKLVQHLGLSTEAVLMSEKDKKRPDSTTASAGDKRKATWEAAPGEAEADKLLMYTMGVDGNGGSAGGNGKDDKSNAKAKKKQTAQSLGVRKLAKVSTKGMKSLSSFFGASKKTKKKCSSTDKK